MKLLGLLLLSLISLPSAGQIICTNLPEGIVITDDIVDEFCPDQVFVPNIFTPNGDDVNDVFQVMGSSIFNEFQLQILNRWGHVVFRSTLPKQGWDGYLAGGEAAEGDYYWIISFARNTGQREQATGRVLLVR